MTGRAASALFLKEMQAEMRFKAVFSACCKKCVVVYTYIWYEMRSRHIPPSIMYIWDTIFVAHVHLNFMQGAACQHPLCVEKWRSFHNDIMSATAIHTTCLKPSWRDRVCAAACCECIGYSVSWPNVLLGPCFEYVLGHQVHHPGKVVSSVS